MYQISMSTLFMAFRYTQHISKSTANVIYFTIFPIFRKAASIFIQFIFHFVSCFILSEGRKHTHAHTYMRTVHQLITHLVGPSARSQRRMKTSLEASVCWTVSTMSRTSVRVLVPLWPIVTLLPALASLPPNHVAHIFRLSTKYVSSQSWPE